MLAIDVLLTEKVLAEDFVSALERRYLPEKFFYWLPLSVKAWLDLCESSASDPGGQGYKNFSRSYELVSKYAAEIAEQGTGKNACPTMEIVSLGAGQGHKDVLLLGAIRKAGGTVHYRPVDTSQALLELALARASDAGFSARGLKADVAVAETFAALAASADKPPGRLYVVLGNSLGVIDPLEFLAALRNLLREQDHVLLDGEIFSAEATMAGYDNPVNRRFAFAPLASVGLEEGRDGALVFETARDPRLEGLHLVSKHFRAAGQLDIPVAGQRIQLDAGERIRMSSSYKYSRTCFLGLLREQGGLQPLAEYVSEDHRFVMVYAAPNAGRATAGEK